MNAVDYIHYALGWAFLIGMLITAIWTICSTIASSAGRILNALYGQPVSPAASSMPTIASRNQRRGDGATVASTLGARP